MKNKIGGIIKSMRRRYMIAEAYRKLKRNVRGPISPSSKYYFMGCCAALIETCGFVPDGYIADVARINLERKLISKSKEETLAAVRKERRQS